MTTPHQLDDQNFRTRLDPGKIGSALGALNDQVAQAVRDAKFRFTAAAKRSHTLAVIGMGGSALGADVVRGVLADKVAQHIIVVRTPSLPIAIRRGTVVLLSSYSGTTMETLAAAKEAKRRKVPMAVITTGGPLASFAKRWGVPLFRINPGVNPSGQPRLGTGSLATGVLMALNALGWWKFSVAERSAVQLSIRQTWQRFHPDVPYRRHPLKQLAVRCASRFLLAIASDRYWGNAHVLANQLNENAKTFAAPFALPELDHHLLEGLRYPAAMKQGLAIILSGMSDESLQPRLRLTQSVLQRQGVQTTVLKGIGTTPLAQAFSFLVQSGVLSYELALLHKVNPSLIPWVDYFKRELAKKSV